jgi:hypothetical protein
MVPDKDGVPQPFRVATPMFYFSERIQLDDGTYAYTVNMEVRRNQWRTFELPAKFMADLRSFKSTLAAYEVIVHHDKLAVQFASEFATKLRQHRDEVVTFKQFGWNKSKTAFAIGQSALSANGRTAVRISTEAIKDPDLLASHEVKGTKEEWTNGVMELYDRPGGLPYQYSILTQFSSPLVALMDYSNWHGIPLALTSEDTGYGKTTVIKIGINALCNSNLTTLSSITPRAIIGRASTMNNMPVLFDELTQQVRDPEDLADVSYTLSNGKPRVGMTSDGKERVPLPPFKLNASITANKNYFEKLAQAKLTPIATQMRIFEIAMESYERMDILKEDSKDHARCNELATHLMSNVYGVWAEDYFTYIGNNKAAVVAKLHETAMAIIRVLGGHAVKERYYAYHLACVLVAGWICRKIGALAFDLKEIRDWAFNHIARMRSNARKYIDSVEDTLARFLSELHGSILVTRHYDILDTRAGKIEVPMLPIKNGIGARLVLGSEKERGKLFVSIRALDDWCVKNDIAPSLMKRQLASGGLLRGADAHKKFDKKTSLSRGVPSHPTGQCRCYEIEYAAAQGYIDEVVGGANVVGIQSQSAATSTKEEPAETAVTA